MKATFCPQNSGEHVKKVIEAALQHADCVLASEQHILAPDFPLGSFCCLVRYVHEATLNQSSQVHAVLQRAPCPRSDAWLALLLLQNIPQSYYPVL